MVTFVEPPMSRFVTWFEVELTFCIRTLCTPYIAIPMLDPAMLRFESWTFEQFAMMSWPTGTLLRDRLLQSW